MTLFLKIITVVVLIVFVILAWQYTTPEKAPPPPHEEQSASVNTSYKKTSLGRYVLALFNSAENASPNDQTDLVGRASATNNDIARYAEPILKDMGFQIDYWDVANGLPEIEAMGKYRAVISWFRDVQMPNAANYCIWMANQINSGKKVILLGNFGAFQESQTGQWLNLSQVNLAFNSLGLDYKSNWTDNADLLKIVQKDPNMVEFEQSLALTNTRYYYLFESLLEDNRSFLTVERTDIPNSRSTLVVITPHGGMCPAKYIYAETPDKFTDNPANSGKGAPVFSLNLKRFLREIFWPPQSQQEEKILVIRDKTNTNSAQLSANVAFALSYAKITSDVQELADLDRLLKDDFAGYSSIVLATSSESKFNPDTVADLKFYVQNGGSLIMLCGNSQEDLGELFGIVSCGGTYERTLRGLEFVVPSSETGVALPITSAGGSPLHPGITQTWVSHMEFITSVFDCHLAPTVRIIAVSQDKTLGYPQGFPLCWRNSLGHGQTLAWNASFMGQKLFRGLVLQSILSTQQVGVSSLANIELIYIDDCPLPMWNILKEPVASEYNLTDTKFYLTRWWPDMVKLAQEFNLHYVSAAVFNYNDEIRYPFDNSQFYIGDNLSSRQLGQALLKAGVEMGLHGYNHQALTIAPRKNASLGWASQDNMTRSLKIAKNLWADIIPYPPTVYVPPDNIVEKEGLDAVTRVFPSIKVFSSLFLQGDKDEDATIREFGPEPWNQSLYCIPRITSGFSYDDRLKLALLNGMELFGVWTHFVHPDDVYDVERSGNKNWAELYQGAHKLFTFVKTTYPWLRNMPLNDAYNEFVRYQNTFVRYYFKPDQVSIAYNSWSANPSFLLLRVNTEARAWKVDGGEIVSDDGHGDYVLRADAANVIVHLVKTGAIAGPEDIAGVIDLAESYIALDRTIDAIPLYEKVEILKPKDLTIHRRLATLYGWTNQTKKETAEYQTILALAPDDMDSRRILAKRLVEQEQLDEAIKQYEAVLKQKPGDQEAQAALADLYKWTGRDEARAQAKLADQVAQNPSDAKAAIELAELYIKMDRVKEAIPLYEKVEVLKPKDLTIHRRLVTLYDWTDQPQKETAEYQSIVGLAPDDMDSRRILAKRLMDQGQFDEAIKQYEKVLEQKPDDREAAAAVAELYRLTGQEEARALAKLEDHVAKNPDDAKAAIELAESYIKSDRLKDAIPLYEKAEALQPHDLAIRQRLATLYSWNNQTQKETSEYEVIAVLTPDDIEINRTLAKRYAELGYVQPAIARYNNIIRLKPDDIEARVALADLYSGNKQTKEANDQYEQILKREPHNLAALRGLGLYNYSLNQYKTARRQLIPVLQNDPKDQQSKETLEKIDLKTMDKIELDFFQNTRADGYVHQQAEAGGRHYFSDLLDVVLDYTKGSFENKKRPGLGIYELVDRNSLQLHGLNRFENLLVAEGVSIDQFSKDTSFAHLNDYQDIAKTWPAQSFTLLLGRSHEDESSDLAPIGRQITVDYVRSSFYWNANANWSLTGGLRGGNYSDNNFRTDLSLGVVRHFWAGPVHFFDGTYSFGSTLFRNANSIASPYWHPNKYQAHTLIFSWTNNPGELPLPLQDASNPNATFLFSTPAHKFTYLLENTYNWAVEDRALYFGLHGLLRYYIRAHHNFFIEGNWVNTAKSQVANSRYKENFLRGGYTLEF